MSNLGINQGIPYSYDIEAFDPSGRIEWSHEISSYSPGADPNLDLNLIRRQAKRLSVEWRAIRLWTSNSAYEIYQDNRFVGKYKLERPLPKEGPKDDPRLLLKSTPAASYAVRAADGHFWVYNVTFPWEISYRSDTRQQAEEEAERLNKFAAGPIKAKDMRWHRLIWCMTIKDENNPEPDDHEKWVEWRDNEVLDLDPKVELENGVYLVEQEYCGATAIHLAAFIKDGKFEIIPTMNALFKGQTLIHGDPFDHIYIEAIEWDAKRKLFTTHFGS